MESQLLFGISLTASFIAGVLALFAPCCITFLFPSYLGTVFKENRKVMLYTIIFALGLSVILIPVALGFRLFVTFLDAYHQQVYTIGALFMVLMGIMTIKPMFHLPQFFHVQPKVDKNINAGSVFGLGVMSGLTSSCCAPVLFAAITLTTLSPSLFQAFFVSIAYVMGIMFPLLVLSVLYNRFSTAVVASKRRTLNTVFTRLGAAIFILSGIAIGIANAMGKIQMNQMDGYSQSVRMTAFAVSKSIGNPVLDVVIFIGFVAVFYLLLRYAWKKEEHHETEPANC